MLSFFRALNQISVTVLTFQKVYDIVLQVLLLLVVTLNIERKEDATMFRVNNNRVLELMIARDLSQRQFALQCGINQVTVAKFIRGNSKLTIKLIGKVARFFNVPISEILDANSVA